VTRPRSILLAVVAGAAMLAGAARADETGPSISDRVVELQNTQASVAHGDLAARTAQIRILREIAAAIAGAKPETWRNPKESRSAIVYLLSGGQPRVVKGLIEGGGIAPEDEKLMKGAIAYQLGREAEARQLLGDADPKALGAALGGQIAFVQGILQSGADPKKALDLLDLARLMMPGGLVEEAALRREMVLTAAPAGDTIKLMTLAAQYFDRFPKSPYAEYFLKSFTEALIRSHLAEAVDNFPLFDAMTATLGRDDRRGFFLAIARAALIAGKIVMADVAATRALGLAQPDSPDEVRAKLFQAAARSLTDQHEAGIAQLQAIDPRKLAKPDQALLAAARVVARHVYEKTADTPLAAPSPPAAPAEDLVAGTIGVAEAALLRAQQVTTGNIR
jgi:chemotaxis protein MotC